MRIYETYVVAERNGVQVTLWIDCLVTYTDHITATLQLGGEDLSDAAANIDECHIEQGNVLIVGDTAFYVSAQQARDIASRFKIRVEAPDMASVTTAPEPA